MEIEQARVPSCARDRTAAVSYGMIARREDTPVTRRQFAASLAAALPARALAADAKAPRSIRITDVQVTVTNPGKAALGNYVLVKIVTNQPGLWGWGDATCSGSELGVAKFLEEH